MIPYFKAYSIIVPLSFFLQKKSFKKNYPVLHTENI